MMFLRSVFGHLVTGTVLFVAASFLMGALLNPGSTSAQSLDEIREQIADHNKQIQELEKEIAGYQRQLNSLGSQKQTLQTSISSLDTQRSKLTAQIRNTQTKIDAQNLILMDLRAQITDSEETISLERQALAETIRKMSVADDASLVEQLFSSSSLTEAWTAADQMAAFNIAVHDHSINLAAIKEELEGQEEQVNASKQQLAMLSSDLSGQRGSLDATKAAKAELLNQTKAQEASYQALINQKRAEQASFQSALFSLSSMLKQADTTTVPAPGKGTLRWPLDSIRITQQFGITADSGRLYASGSHDGMDFAAAVGTPVRAALAGTVQEINHGAVQNCQYGKWVIVKHNNGLSTLYAHLSSIDVTKGSTVASGQILGSAGMTGYATGPHLHFTVYNSSSLSFKQYTCKSGPTVTIPIAPPNGYLNPMSYL
jgi:murein DD-endopeptidase MepM/ murein hydrolase activator NlpD